MKKNIFKKVVIVLTVLFSIIIITSGILGLSRRAPANCYKPVFTGQINYKYFSVPLNMVRHIYTMEYYAAIKNDEFGSFVGTWMNLETIILSKLTEEQKIKHRMFSLIGGC